MRSVSVPPVGMASTALMIRFASASRSSAARPPICGTWPSSAVTRIVWPLAWAWSRQRGCESEIAWATRSLSWTGGSSALDFVGRENSRSRPTTPAASCAAEWIRWRWARRFCGVFDLLGVREQQLGEADDHREGVVEVVGDAARELAERLEPLLAQHHLLGVLNVRQRLLQSAVHLAKLFLHLDARA